MAFRFDRKRFFDAYRASFGALKHSQVEGLEVLLGAIEADPSWKSVEEAAYVLATVQHETARTFQPIKEYRARQGTKLRATQDRYWLSGFYGRGYVMITWEANYKKFGIAETPEKALEPETAYRILAEGMRQGSFTGKKLSDFVNEHDVDYYNARTVVNGHDKALQIADNAEKFEHVLKAALVTESVTEPAKIEEKPAPDKVPEPEKKDQPVETLPTTPPIIEVKNQGASITTKIAAGISAVTPVLTATGLKIGGVELTTGALYAFAAIAIVGIVTAAYIYNRGQDRAFERQKLSMNNLADRGRNNVVAGTGT